MTVNKQKRNYVPEDSGKEKIKAMQDWRRNRKASRAKQQMQERVFNNG